MLFKFEVYMIKKKLNPIIKILPTLMFVFTLYLILNPVFVEVTTFSIFIFLSVNISYVLLVFYLYTRLKKITNNSSIAKRELSLLLVFLPYMLYYLWYKDDQILEKYSVC